MARTRVNTSNKEFEGDYLTFELGEGTSEGGVHIQISVLLESGRRRNKRDYSNITVNIGDLVRALTRLGIEIDNIKPRK